MNKYLVCALAILAAGESVAESDISYNYGQIGYTRETLDNYDCTQDGLRLAGNFELTADLFLTGALTDVSGGVCGSTTVNAGAGYKVDIEQDLSVYTSLSVARTTVDAGGDDTGLVLAAGGRALLTDKIEARAEVSHATAFDGVSTLNMGLNYWFDPRIAIVGDVNFSADSTAFSIAARMNF